VHITVTELGEITSPDVLISLLVVTVRATSLVEVPVVKLAVKPAGVLAVAQPGTAGVIEILTGMPVAAVEFAGVKVSGPAGDMVKPAGMAGILTFNVLPDAMTATVLRVNE
jgi:hypothetical protein